MTPLTVMRIAGWTFLTVGILFTVLGLVAIAMTRDQEFPLVSGGIFLLIGVISGSVGARWAFRAPSERELVKWARRSKRK
jgi:multisubunit Na+/H+ antiporter MnhG subunit